MCECPHHPFNCHGHPDKCACSKLREFVDSDQAAEVIKGLVQAIENITFVNPEGERNNSWQEDINLNEHIEKSLKAAEKYLTKSK